MPKTHCMGERKINQAFVSCCCRLPGHVICFSMAAGTPTMEQLSRTNDISLCYVHSNRQCNNIVVIVVQQSAKESMTCSSNSTARPSCSIIMMLLLSRPTIAVLSFALQFGPQLQNMPGTLNWEPFLNCKHNQNMARVMWEVSFTLQ
jgi:hypothetical protein